ncbi:c-type cytochrome [Sulfurimonas sp.]
MKVLFLALVALFFLGCSEDKKSDEKALQTQKEELVQAKAEVKEPAKIEPKKVLNAVKEVPAEKAVSQTVKVTPEVVEPPKKPVVEVEKVKTEIVPKEVAVIDKNEINGSIIFKKCASCHGKNAEKKALGKSQIIQGWNKMKIVNALKGYKDGTYGGAMKAVMKGQASGLSDADVNAVAEYISKL